MTVVVFVLLSYVLLALISPLLGELGLALYAPDLSVAMLLAASFRLGTTGLVIFAFFTGLLMDGFSPLTPVGLHAERMVVLAYACRAIFASMPVRTTAGRVVVGMLLVLVSDFVLFVLLALFDRSLASYGAIFERMLPHALVTGATLPLVEWIFDRTHRRLSRKKDSIFYS